MEDRSRLIRYLTIIVIVTLVIIFGTFIISNLSNGTITVTAENKQDIITINGDNFNKQAKAYLSVKVKSGDYNISVQGHVDTVNKSVHLKAHQHLKFTFKQSTVKSTMPVAGINAANIAADNTQILFTNPSTPGLFKIDQSNNLTEVNNSSTLVNVKWANVGYGIGEDGRGNLYLINSGVISHLNVPSDYLPVSNSSYAINQQHQIYLSINNDIYVSSNGINFSKIYTTKTKPIQLVSFPNGLTIITPPNNSKSKVLITNISKSGKVIKSTQAQLGTYSWSVNGKYLAIGGDGPGEIFDSSFKQIAILPSNVNQSLWLNNETLLYSSNNTIWSYSLNSGDARILARLTPSDSIREFAVDTNKNNIYAAVDKSNGVSVIEKISLSSSNPPAISSQLDVFFPKIISGCYIDYINFSSTSLLVATEPGSSSSCQSVTQTEIANDNLDSKEFQINYTNTLPPEVQEVPNDN